MKVWKIEASGNYCGGFALVAAHTDADARDRAREVREPTWPSLKWDTPELCEEVPKLEYDGPSCVIAHYAMGE